jgi:hypothetical protein
MTRRPGRVQFDLDERLIDTPERNQGLDWPLPVDMWLDSLVESARRAGMTTTRKELSAALVTSVEPGEEALVDLIRSYRRRTGRDLLGVSDDADNVIAFERRPPGPRKRPRPRTSG